MVLLHFNGVFIRKASILGYVTPMYRNHHVERHEFLPRKTASISRTKQNKIKSRPTRGRNAPAWVWTSYLGKSDAAGRWILPKNGEAKSSKLACGWLATMAKYLEFRILQGVDFGPSVSQVNTWLGSTSVKMEGLICTWHAYRAIVDLHQASCVTWESPKVASRKRTTKRIKKVGLLLLWRHALIARLKSTQRPRFMFPTKKHINHISHQS